MKYPSRSDGGNDNDQCSAVVVKAQQPARRSLAAKSLRRFQLKCIDVHEELPL
jgi:hypothetical protein